MIYEIDKDPYIDLKTGILRNLLDINNQSILDQVEAEISALKSAIILDNPIPGDLNLEYYQNIHQILFSTIYQWAGKLRTIEISKGKTKFASVAFLFESAKNVFDELNSDIELDNLEDRDYSIKLAHYYSEINILHPFREGNGRTQRVFFSVLAQRSDRHIAWELLSKEENEAACVQAYNGDDSYLVSVFNRVISSKNGVNL